jgi:regulator of protease activity HflC (stomatin/prohibitin superfamily)
VSKQHTQTRSSLDDALKSLSADVQLLQAHVRQVEASSSSAQAEARRQVAHAEAEARRQCDALGRAIHSLADTMNLTSPLIPTSPRRERRAVP